MPTKSAIFDIQVVMKPAEERKQLKEDIKEARLAIKEWETEIEVAEKRLAELKGKR